MCPRSDIISAAIPSFLPHSNLSIRRICNSEIDTSATESLSTIRPRFVKQFRGVIRPGFVGQVSKK
jgi:hypothetical protein